MNISDDTRKALASRRERGLKFPQNCGLDVTPLDAEARELAEDLCLAADDLAADAVSRRDVVTLLARALATIDLARRQLAAAIVAADEEQEEREDE